MTEREITEKAIYHTMIITFREIVSQLNDKKELNIFETCLKARAEYFISEHTKNQKENPESVS